MSDAGDDLFPPSPPAAPAFDEPKVEAPVDEPVDTDTQPVASTSKSPSPRPKSPSGSASPAKRSFKDPDEDEDVDDLFGDDEEEDAKPASPRSERGRSSTATPVSKRSEGSNVDPLEYAEEDADDVEDPNAVTATLPLPKIPRMQATDGKVWHLKLPLYVNLDSRPYDGDYYKELERDEETIDGKEEPKLAKQKILTVKNTVRWKWTSGTDGKPMPVSNSRLVRWSDGSVSMQLGEDLFDVNPSWGTTLARPEDPVKEADKKPVDNPTTTFLCVPSQHERVLVTETAIAGQLSLVPASSTSKTHIELVKHVGAQHVKHSRMKILDDVHNAEELDIFHKKSLGPDFKPKAKRRTNSGTGKHRRTSRSRRDADEDSGSDRGPSRRSRAADWNESDDGFVVDDDDDESEAQASDDEDDFEAPRSKKKSKSRKRKGGEDEDVDEDEDEDDPLAQAERHIRRQEKRRKTAKKAKTTTTARNPNRDFSDEDEDEDDDAEGEADAGGEAEMDMDMDVESEDD